MSRNRAISYAAICSVVLITLLTILGELLLPFKNFLISLTGHHWITKSGVSILVYLAVLAAVGRGKVVAEAPERERCALLTLSAVAAACSAVIFVFFLALFLGR